MLQYSLNTVFPGFSVAVVIVAFISAFLLCELLAHLEVWRFIFDGPSIISRNYKKAQGGPFVVRTPNNLLTLVSSPKHIKELEDAPNDCLSLAAASKELFQPKYTMHGFEWADRRGTDGVGFVRVLRSLLTSHLPALLPDIRSAISVGLEEELAGHKNVDGLRYSPVLPMIEKVVTKANCVIFFGTQLSCDSEFLEAALQYPKDVFILAEIMRLTPKLIAPAIARVMNSRHTAQKTVFKILSPIVEQRLALRSMNGNTAESPVDCMQWLIDTSPRKKPWTIERTVHEIMAVWFSSMPQLIMATTYTLHDLCLHKEYVEPLRRELEGGQYHDFEATAHGLPLMDSFIKESSRLTPTEAISVRRMALKPFFLSDGFKVARGDWACVPMRAMNLDSKYYSDPMTFNGFRFAQTNQVDGVLSSQPSKYTDASDTWLHWGSGSKSCAGRYYAAVVQKLILAHVLTNYDCELADEKAGRSMWWRTSITPLPKTAIVFRSRTTL